MFERRLKIFLAFLITVSSILLLRAFHEQVVARASWRERAREKESRQITTPTTRGRILDCMGRELAVDLPCVDACVDFRAILVEPERAWLRERATERIAANRRDEFRHSNASGKEKIRAEEEQIVRDQIQNMWETLEPMLPRLPEARSWPAAGKGFDLTLPVPRKGVPYCVIWYVPDDPVATRRGKLRMGCYNFFLDHHMPALARRFVNWAELHYIPSSEIKE
jgi:hypothetical protein